MAEEVLKAMKYPNAVIKVVKAAIEHHEDFSSYMGSSIPRPAVIRQFVSKFEGNERALDVCLNLIHANNITQMYGKKIKQVPGIREKLAEMEKKNESGKKIVLPCDGKEVMKLTGLKAGPTLGVIMSKIKNKVIENPHLTKDEALSFAVEYLKAIV